jgi:hypothetical protein
MNISQILTAISSGEFSDAELRQINSIAVAKIKARRSVNNQLAKAALVVGMKVKVNHPKLAGRQFILSEIKRTKASVRPEGEFLSGYNVPLSLVEAV